MAPATITPELMEFQAQRIDSILAAHRVRSRVSGGQATHRWMRYNLHIPDNARVSQVRNLREEFGVALGVDNVQVLRRGSNLAIEVPRPDPKQITLADVQALAPGTPSLTATLGITDTDRPLLLRFSAPDVAHVLVSGTTGSGKTELLRTMLLSLLLNTRQSKLQVALIDFKHRGLAPFAEIPHLLTDTATNVAHAQQILKLLVETMERRDAQQLSSPTIVLVIDELLDLITLGGKPIQQLLTRLAQRGREAGIHIIAGAQKPSASVVGGQLTANFSVRLVGRMVSAADALVAAGISGTGAEKLQGRGDFMAVFGSDPIRFQAAYVPMPDWNTHLGGIR